MAAIGSASTRLIVLRGDSGSGKTTTAAALRPLLGYKTAVIHQDYFRPELLAGGEEESRSADAAVLVDAAARQSLDLGHDVILDGIFNLRDYARRLEQLWRDHRGLTRIYQFDVSLDETVRRHETRELRHAFTAEKMHEWYDGWQPLEFVEEGRIGPTALAGSTPRDCSPTTDITAGLSAISGTKLRVQTTSAKQAPTRSRALPAFEKPVRSARRRYLSRRPQAETRSSEEASA